MADGQQYRRLMALEPVPEDWDRCLVLGGDFDPDVFLRGNMATVGQEVGVEHAVAVELL